MEKTLEVQDRIKKLTDLRSLGINPYPAQAGKHGDCIQAKESPIGAQVSIAGRLLSKRLMGKLCFCHVRDASGQIQTAFSQEQLGKDNYKIFTKNFDIGDFVELKGEIFTTHHGETTILVKTYCLLSKALRPLPEKWHGLQNEEERLRKRYLDLLFNPEIKELFIKKARFWSSMREFLISKGFIEVETPILEITPGGADAQPFITHHQALNIDVYLRISTGELWQKRLMVGGFEKTFEIGRQFRNEGMSREHLQDYTQMEFYWAYANYEQGMDMAEEMFKYVIKQTFGTLRFDIGKFNSIDLEKKWERITYVEEIKRQIKLDVLNANDEELKNKINDLDIKAENLNSRARLIDALWKFCRKNIKGPVFLTDHPVIVSPLAKRKTDNTLLTERYQIIIAGSELGNGYSELNDPIDQAERFREQVRLRQAGDMEAQMHDADFIEALEHGMPPTTGFGVSERLFSFLADKPIRECVLFPLMKPERLDVKVEL